MRAIVHPISIWQGRTSVTASVLQAVVLLFPNVKARVEWHLCTEAGMPVAQGLEEMTGDDFNAWANDDAHVFRWLCGVLGLTAIEIGEPPAPPSPPADDSNGPGMTEEEAQAAGIKG